MNITPFMLAQRYVGIKEIAGEKNHPLVSWWLSLCGFSLDTPDEVPWCSAFVNGIAWELRLPRSKSAAARSWLAVGTPIQMAEAHTDGDLVILSRGENPLQGHVGWYAGLREGRVLLLAGNQQNGVMIEAFDALTVLGIRRITDPLPTSGVKPDFPRLA